MHYCLLLLVLVGVIYVESTSLVRPPQNSFPPSPIPNSSSKPYSVSRSSPAQTPAITYSPGCPTSATERTWPIFSSGSVPKHPPSSFITTISGVEIDVHPTSCAWSKETGVVTFQSNASISALIGSNFTYINSTNQLEIQEGDSVILYDLGEGNVLTASFPNGTSINISLDSGTVQLGVHKCAVVGEASIASQPTQTQNSSQSSLLSRQLLQDQVEVTLAIVDQCGNPIDAVVEFACNTLDSKRTGSQNTLIGAEEDLTLVGVYHVICGSPRLSCLETKDQSITRFCGLSTSLDAITAPCLAAAEVGAVIGGAIGFLAGEGIGAIPGTALGAELGIGICRAAIVTAGLFCQGVNIASANGVDMDTLICDGLVGSEIIEVTATISGQEILIGEIANGSPGEVLTTYTSTINTICTSHVSTPQSYSQRPTDPPPPPPPASPTTSSAAPCNTADFANSPIFASLYSHYDSPGVDMCDGCCAQWYNSDPSLLACDSTCCGSVENGTQIEGVCPYGFCIACCNDNGCGGLGNTV